MATYTGTVTSTQGTLTLGSTPNDIITFTPSSATYTVEYPIGTVALNGATTTQSVTLTNGGQMRITCASGSVAYSLVEYADKPVLSDAQTTLLQALATTAGTAWASRVAAATAGAGAMMWADLGTGVPPILMRSDGTNWRAIAPAVLARKTAITTGLTQTADQIIGQLGPIPAGVLYSGAVFMLRYSVGRDVNTDAYGTATVIRVGTAGTVADAALASVNLSANFPAGSGGLSIGFDNYSYMTSATSALKGGAANAGTSYSGATSSGAALNTAATISDVTANALYFSISTTMATAVTSKPQTGYMELVLLP